MTYTVSITAAKGDQPRQADIIYTGDSYQSAFDAAVEARSNMAWRGKWIRFSERPVGALGDNVKWAQIS